MSDLNSGPAEPIKEGFPDPDLERMLEREDIIDEELKRDNRTSIGLSEINSRFCDHGQTKRTAEMHRAVHSLFLDGAIILDHILPMGRAKHLAMTKLEEALMWSNRAIDEMAPVVDQ